MPITDTLHTIYLSPFVGSTMHLYTVAPTDQTGGEEVEGGSYSPQESTLTQDEVDQNVARNVDAIVFTGLPECTVVAIGIKDSSGTLLYYDSMTTPKTYSEGGIATIAAGSFNITVGAT